MTNNPAISRAELIDGWMSIQELEWLTECAEKCKTIVEVGSYKGRSTRALADNTRGIVYSIDPYKGEYYYNDGTVHFISDDRIFDEFKINLADHLESGRVIHFRTELHNAPYFWADMIFIDGDHRYKEVRADIYEALRRTRKGGIVSGHDYGQHAWPGVKKAVDEIFGKPNVEGTIWWVSI